MARTPQLLRLPHWFEHRTLSGAVAADAVLPGFAPNPASDTFDASGFEGILFYWMAAGEDLVNHTITFEPLFYDGVNGIWLRQQKVTLKPREIGEFPTHTSSQVFVRLDAVVAGGASDLKLRVTGGLPERRL